MHIIPLLAAAALLVSGFSVLTIRSEEAKKEAVGKVLSSSSGSGSSGETKVESKSEEGRTKIETSSQKTKVEVRGPEGRFETKIEEGKEETKIRTGGLRIEVKREGDRVVTRVKNEDDEEVELEEEELEELRDEAEEGLEEEGVRIATGEAQPVLVQDGRRVRTNFPLSVSATGELMVTTPAGTKVVAVLPRQAVNNMLTAGILTRVEEGVVAGEATSGAAVQGGIELTKVNNTPVYVITGVRQQNFLGLVPVAIKIKTVVSAENGQLLDVQQGILARALDLLSF